MSGEGGQGVPGREGEVKVEGELGLGLGRRKRTCTNSGLQLAGTCPPPQAPTTHQTDFGSILRPGGRIIRRSSVVHLCSFQRLVRGGEQSRLARLVQVNYDCDGKW